MQRRFEYAVYRLRLNVLNLVQSCTSWFRLSVIYVGSIMSLHYPQRVKCICTINLLEKCCRKVSCVNVMILCLIFLDQDTDWVTTMKILALLCLCSALTFTLADDPLLISAFNVQIFGKSKMSEQPVVDTLVEVRIRENNWWPQSFKFRDKLHLQAYNRPGPRSHGATSVSAPASNNIPM